MNEEKIPEWLDTSKFIKTLNNNIVFTETCNQILLEYEPKYGLQKGSPLDDAKFFLPIVKEKLRYYDIRDLKYWFWSVFTSLIFLMLEFILLLIYNFGPIEKNNKLLLELSLLLVGIIILLFNFVVIGYILLTNTYPKFINGKPIQKEQLFFTTVMVLFFFLVSINLLLVIRTGFEESPFLPALVFVALTIIGAPRENSKTIVILNLLIILIVLTIMANNYFLSIFEYLKITPLFEYKLILVNNNLFNFPNIFNLITFGFAAIVQIILRTYGSKKFIN